MFRQKRCFLSLALALALSCSLVLAPSHALSHGMSNFQKAAEYAAFPDVDPAAWYAADVQKAVELGILTGKSGGTFDPTAPLTLAEAVTMAAKVRSIYEGGGFTPGGSPWYQNAVNYAVQKNILAQGEFTDFTALATRAQMAGIFAYTLPYSDTPRINRVVNIPDVDADTPYVDGIYLLYNAGIVTGDAAGAYKPGDNITRAEAAAIINRLALPDSRKVLNLSTPPAGTAYEDPDGAFRMYLPDGWTVEQSDKQEGYSNVYFNMPTGYGYVAVTGITDKTILSYPVTTLAGADMATLKESHPEVVYELYGTSLFRGLYSCSAEFTSTQDGEELYFYHIYVDAGDAYYELQLGGSTRMTAAEWDACWDLAYSFDLAL